MVLLGGWHIFRKWKRRWRMWSRRMSEASSKRKASASAIASASASATSHCAMCWHALVTAPFRRNGGAPPSGLFVGPARRLL